jgi:hypothetical protein
VTSTTPSDPVSEAQKFKRLVRPLLGVVALLFVGVAVRDVVQRWGETEVTLDPGLAAVACAPLFGAALLQGQAWILLVERMADRRVPRAAALGLYLFSQLARYTPGKVGLPLVRMAGASRLGLTPGLVGVSVLVENLSWTATGAVVGFGWLALAVSKSGIDGVLGALAVPALCASVIGLVVLSVLDRSRYPKFARRLLAPEGSGPIVPLLLPLVQLGYWLLIAVHGFLLSQALGASFEASVSAMAFYVIASVAGFVVLAAPAGLGVREAVLLAGLTPSVGASGALGAAVISRAASLAADVLIWLLVRALSPGLRADDAR